MNLFSILYEYFLSFKKFILKAITLIKKINKVISNKKKDLYFTEF